MRVNRSERIIDAGTTLTLTCVYAFEDENQRNTFNFSWEIPDYLTKNAEVYKTIFCDVDKNFSFSTKFHPQLIKKLSDLDNRLRKTFGRNETHMTSTLSLANARARDTGNFGCKGLPIGFPNTFTVNQYVYVFSSLN